MSDPTPIDMSYRTIVIKFIDQMQTLEGMNLLRYHQVGRLFTEFLEGLTRGSFIGASVEQLGKDLQQNGVLTDIRDAPRMLYYAKSVYAAHPDAQQLIALAKQGFSLTHSKLLMGCPQTVQDAVLEKALVNGRFIPTKQFMALITEESGSKVSPAEILMAIGREEPTPTDGGPRAPDVAVPVDVRPDLPGNAPLPTPTPSPGPAAATTNTIEPERTVAPAKTLKTVNSLLDKLTVALPDVFILVKESRRGSDNIPAHDTYLATIADVSVAAKGVRSVLSELISAIDDEVGAGRARAAE